MVPPSGAGLSGVVVSSGVRTGGGVGVVLGQVVTTWVAMVKARGSVKGLLRDLPDLRSHWPIVRIATATTFAIQVGRKSQ